MNKCEIFEIQDREKKHSGQEKNNWEYEHINFDVLCFILDKFRFLWREI